MPNASSNSFAVAHAVELASPAASRPDEKLIAREDERTEWQKSLADLITDPRELLNMLQLDGADLPIPAEVLHGFPMRVPRPYAARIQPGRPDDPLLLQILPADKERDDTPGFTIDPLSEAKFNPEPGLLHKYQGRALLLVAPHCAVHCRYCFRRHFPYEQNTPSRSHWNQTLAHLARDSSITEVIFSGGDPLAANDRQLSWLAEAVAAIPHVQRLRIHTRTPIMIPERVDQALLDWLNRSRLQTVMVIHSNHAQELDEAVVEAMHKLRSAGVQLLNQSVLLRGVNDSVDALRALSEKLFSAQVLPYYIHLLDRVQGVAHFEVPEQEAIELMTALRNCLPGYLVPRLVREIPGEGSKTTVF